MTKTTHLNEFLLCTYIYFQGEGGGKAYHTNYKSFYSLIVYRLNISQNRYIYIPMKI